MNKTITPHQDALNPLEQNLELLKSGNEKLLQSELTPIGNINSLEILSQTKEKISNICYNVKRMSKEIRNFEIQEGDAKIKSQEMLNKYLRDFGLATNPLMTPYEIEEKSHEAFSVNSQPISVNYEGEVEINESIPFNGVVDYNGTVSHRGWGLFAATEEVPYNGRKSYNGQVPYNKKHKYNGKKVVNCQATHHKCQCELLSNLISSFYEVLAEKEKYKESFEKQKKSTEIISEIQMELQKDMENTPENINLLQEKGLLALSTIQNERQLFLNGMKDNVDKILFTFSIVNQVKESEQNFQNRLNEFAEKKEEIKNKEEIKLEERFKTLENEKLQEIEKMKKEQEKLNQLLSNNSQENMKILQEKDNKINSMLEETYKLKMNFTEKEYKQNAEFTIEKSVLEANLRSLLPNLFEKLCVKAGVDENKVDEYCNSLVDKSVSLNDIISRIEKYMMKERKKL